MKKWVVPILVITLIVLSFKDALLFVSFKINQTFIADQWCINTAQPELMCAGSCYLTQQFIAQHEGPINSIQHILNHSFEIEYVDLTHPLIISFPTLNWNAPFFKVDQSHAFLWAFDIFHPPKC